MFFQVICEADATVGMIDSDGPRQPVCDVGGGRQNFPGSGPCFGFTSLDPAQLRLKIVSSRNLTADLRDMIAVHSPDLLGISGRSSIKPKNGGAQRISVSIQKNCRHPLTTDADSRQMLS